MVLSYLWGAHVNFLNADFVEDTEVAKTYPSEFSTLWKSLACLHTSYCSRLAHQWFYCAISTHWLGCVMRHVWLFNASWCESLRLRSSHAKGPVMWSLSRALSSFPITTVCHLHLQRSNFLCGWLMPWLLSSLKADPLSCWPSSCRWRFFARSTLPYLLKRQGTSKRQSSAARHYAWPNWPYAQCCVWRSPPLRLHAFPKWLRKKLRSRRAVV